MPKKFNSINRFLFFFFFLLLFCESISGAVLKMNGNGRQQLILHEYTFNRHVVRDRPNIEDSITYWRCSQFPVYRCRARCKTQNGKICLLNEKHNHDVVREQRKYGALKEIKRKLSKQQSQSSKSWSTNIIKNCSEWN